MYVYKITNTVNGKGYIGQSMRNDNIRLNNHRSLLNRGVHPNVHLQSAWNKYGKEQFLFEKIYHPSSVEELDRLEVELIERYKTVDRKHGYNIFSGGHHQHSVPHETRKKIGAANAGNTHSNEQREKWAREKRENFYAKYIVSPDGIRYEVPNIRKFAKVHNIDRGNLMRVLRGKSYHVTGWRLPETPVEYLDVGYAVYKRTSKLQGRKLLGPDGLIYTIDKPLTQFCKEHGIRPAKIRLVLHGSQSYHRGWYKV